MWAAPWRSPTLLVTMMERLATSDQFHYFFPRAPGPSYLAFLTSDLGIQDLPRKGRLPRERKDFRAGPRSTAMGRLAFTSHLAASRGTQSQAHALLHQSQRLK